MPPTDIVSGSRMLSSDRGFADSVEGHGGTVKRLVYERDESSNEYASSVNYTIVESMLEQA